MKRSKFKLLLSGVITLVLLLLGISASFGVYYKQYTTLMKMYAEQYASLIHYQKSGSNDDPNPTYSIMMRYHPIDNMRSLSNDQTQQTEQYTHHQKIYQIKTLPAKHTLVDTSFNQKYNITHHHVEKISSTNVKDDEIDNVLLFRSDGSINILTYEEYLQEEEQLKDLSDEELGFEKFDTKTATSIERHQHLGVLDDRPSFHVSGNIMGNIDISKNLDGNIHVKSIQGNIILDDVLTGNIQAKSLTGDISISENLVGNIQAKSLTGNIHVSNNLVGNIDISDSLTGCIHVSNNLVGYIDISESLEGHFSAKTITLENVADGKAAINVGDINSANDGIHVQGSIESTNGNSIHIDGDVISKKGVGINVGKTVQSELDSIHIEGSIKSTNGNGIRIDRAIQSELDGIKTAISSENGYALSISGNINAAGGLLVQNGNITTNGKQLDPSDEPYAGVRMKCVQDLETNKCTVGGYIVTTDAFGVQLEGGVQTTIVQGIDMGIHLGAAVEIGNVVSDGQGISIGDIITQNGQGISIGDISTQNGQGISAQHITSKEGHAISVLTAASTYASVDSSQTGSDYPSVIQVRNIETDSSNVDGIRVSKVSTNTGIAIHVYETDAEDEPGIITSNGIGIKVGDKKDESYRIETVDTSISVQGGVKSTDGLGISLNGDVQSNHNSAIIIDGGLITHAGDNIDTEYYAFKANYIDASQNTASPIKSGPYGVHVGWIKSYNDSIHINNADTDGNALVSNASAIKVVKGDIVGSRRNIILTKSQNETLQTAHMAGSTELLSNAKKELAKQLSTSAVVDLGGNIQLNGFDTSVTVNYPNDISNSESYSTYTNRFSPGHMIHVGGNIQTVNNIGVETIGINITGNINTGTSADAIHVGGDIYGSNGFVLDGVMKDIRNTAILIQNNKNEAYAIKAQNGIILGSISPSTEGSIHFSNYGIDIRGDVTTERGGLGIRVQGNVESQQTTIRVTGNVKQKSDRYEANAIAIGGNVESVGSDAVSVNGNVIGAKSGILVKGTVKTTSTKWECSSQCATYTTECQNCIDELKERLNQNNIHSTLPAAISVKRIVSEQMGYGINIWANINASNDAIRVNNDFDTEKPAVQSYYGPSIHINGNLVTEYHTSTVYLNGSVINNFYIQNITVCKNSDTQNNSYINDVAAIYVKEVKTILPDVTEPIKINDSCQSGIQRTTNGIIVDRIESFNKSIIIMEKISSKGETAININSNADIYGYMNAINFGICSSIRSEQSSPLTLNYVAILNYDDDVDDYSIHTNNVYTNRQIFTKTIQYGDFYDICVNTIKP